MPVGNYLIRTHISIPSNVPKAGSYRVYAWFGPDPAGDHASNAPLTITTAGKSVTKRIDLRSRKDEWVYLGTFTFAAGRKATIAFSNAADGNVLADAVKLVSAGVDLSFPQNKIPPRRFRFGTLDNLLKS